MRKIEAPYYTQRAMIFRLRFWGKALSINTDCGVGMTAEKAKTLAAQRFGPAQIDSDNQMITVSKAVLTENCAGGFGVKARKTPPGDHPL